MSRSDATEEKLVELFALASADAASGPRRFRALVECLYRAYSSDVLALARRRVPESRADDVASATWEAVSRALEGFRGDATFHTWLLHIAANKAVDELRRGQAGRYDALSSVISRLVAKAPSHERPSREVARAEMKQAMHDVIAQLEPDDQELLLLHYQEGQSAADIARARGLPPNTVAQRLVRTRTRLKKLFEAAGLE